MMNIILGILTMPRGKFTNNDSILCAMADIPGIIGIFPQPGGRNLSWGFD